MTFAALALGFILFMVTLLVALDATRPWAKAKPQRRTSEDLDENWL